MNKIWKIPWYDLHQMDKPVFFLFFFKSHQGSEAACECHNPTVADSNEDLLALITLALAQTRLLCKGTGLFLESTIRGNTHSSPTPGFGPAAPVSSCWRSGTYGLYVVLERRVVWDWGAICYYVLCACIQIQVDETDVERWTYSTHALILNREQVFCFVCFYRGRGHGGPVIQRSGLSGRGQIPLMWLCNVDITLTWLRWNPHYPWRIYTCNIYPIWNGYKEIRNIRDTENKHWTCRHWMQKEKQTTRWTNGGDSCSEQADGETHNTKKKKETDKGEGTVEGEKKSMIQTEWEGEIWTHTEAENWGGGQPRVMWTEFKIQ